MKVLYTPYFEANEYQNLLIESVEHDGVTPIKGMKTGPFALTRQYLAIGSIDIAHLIWTHPFFIIPESSESGPKTLFSMGRSLGRAIVFLLDVLLLKLLGVKIVWTIHNKHNHERHHVRLDRTVSRILTTLADQITVECTTAKQTVIELFHVSDPSKVHVIPEGNYVDAYPNTTSRDKARQRLGIDDDTFLFVFFGQIRTYKDVPGLVEAFDNLDCPDTHLLIAGNPASDELKSKLQGRVSEREDVSTVFKFVPNDQIQQYMNAADVVVLPYRDIMTSGSVLLAMSFGRAVVAPDMGCIPELLDETGGFLYQYGDPNALENALREAYEAGDRVRSLGKHNYRLATKLSWDHVGRETVTLYRRVLNG